MKVRDWTAATTTVSAVLLVIVHVTRVTTLPTTVRDEDAKKIVTETEHATTGHVNATKVCVQSVCVESLRLIIFVFSLDIMCLCVGLYMLVFDAFVLIECVKFLQHKQTMNCR